MPKKSDKSLMAQAWKKGLKGEVEDKYVKANWPGSQCQKAHKKKFQAERLDMAKTLAWQRSEGKNPRIGLNAKGRTYARHQGMNLKPPVNWGDNLAEQVSCSV